MTATLALLSFVLATDAGTVDAPGVDAPANDAGTVGKRVMDAGAPGLDGATAEPASRQARHAEPHAEQAVAIAGVRTNEPVVALTFDACATRKQANGFDRQIFDILVRDKIPATLYVSGRWVETHPRAAKLIATADFLELGNHTYTHPRLSLMPPDRVHFQIASTNQIVAKVLGRKALTLRPPAGAWNNGVLQIAKEEEMPLVLWTVVSGDVGGHIPAPRIVRTVLEQTKPGAIVIFHINKRAPFTKQALPAIIAGLRAKGFRFVTVSQLLALPDAVPVPAKPSTFGYGMHKKPVPQDAQPSGDKHADPPT